MGEDKGLLPDPEWKTEFYKDNFSDPSKPSYDPNWLFDSSWNAADSINLSIGQGNLNVTPLQLAVGYSAIANGGTVVTPHVVNAIEAPNEPTRIQPSPPRGTINIGASLLNSVRSGPAARDAPRRTARRPTCSATSRSRWPARPAPRSAPTSPTTRSSPRTPRCRIPKYVTVVVIERGGHGGVAGALTALDFYSKVFKVPEPNLGTVVDEST